jgi:hypothetical protein
MNAPANPKPDPDMKVSAGGITTTTALPRHAVWQVKDFAKFGREGDLEAIFNGLHQEERPDFFRDLDDIERAVAILQGLRKASLS